MLFNSFAAQAKMLFSLFGIIIKKKLTKMDFSMKEALMNASNKVPEARSM